ncbi:MAG: porin [Deltaproteobacteria bacterium]|nr:porin [Deltaproteobacteria bacterium]
MKGKIFAAGLLAALAVGQNADAKSLEDILKEKGVITEADYKEVGKSKPIDYKLGKGFTFTSADEKFQLSLGGRMQFRYTFTDFDTADFDTKSDSSTWDAKRIKLILGGYAYTKDLTYKVELDLRQSGSFKMLQDAFLNYKFIDEVQLRAGQYKVPFARQELTSDGSLSFVDRSPVVDAFKASYDIGAMVHGKVAGGFAEYNLGVFGGLGQTTARATNDNMFAARVAVNPLGEMAYNEPDFERSKQPLLSIGANYFLNTLQRTGANFESAASNYAGSSGWLGSQVSYITTADRQKVDINSYGVDLAFKWMGLAVQGEYLLGQAENQITDKLLRAQGFYAQAGYMILPKLEAAVRYSYYDRNRDVSNDLKTEVIGAVSYYFNKHNLKLTADVASLHTQGGKTDPITNQKLPSDDMQYRLQAQIIF